MLAPRKGEQRLNGIAISRGGCDVPATGYAGTFFWVDPKEEIVGVYMTQAPSPIRAYYRKMFKSLVYQALVD